MTFSALPEESTLCCCFKQVDYIMCILSGSATDSSILQPRSVLSTRYISHIGFPQCSTEAGGQFNIMGTTCLARCLHLNSSNRFHCQHQVQQHQCALIGTTEGFFFLNLVESMDIPWLKVSLACRFGVSFCGESFVQCGWYWFPLSR